MCMPCMPLGTLLIACPIAMLKLSMVAEVRRCKDGIQNDTVQYFKFMCLLEGVNRLQCEAG